MELIHIVACGAVSFGVLFGLYRVIRSEWRGSRMWP